MENTRSTSLKTVSAIALSFVFSASAGGIAQARDEFDWLNEFNKASAVMVVEKGIVSKQLGSAIAKAIDQVERDGAKPGAARPGMLGYLDLERQLIAIGGSDVTRLHSGRSRQDLIATYNRVVLRQRLLDTLDRVDGVRSRLLNMSQNNVETIVPAYTNGVQAQPITLAHYLLAFDAALSRDGARLREAYPRVNRSPLGAAALATSSFPVDRPRLAALLGFDVPEENSYDANLVSSMDVPLEVIDISQSLALTIGALVEDLVEQYRNPQPWFQLREGVNTGPSSIMPQKRNPFGLSELRSSASSVVAKSFEFALLAHNVSPGMLDYKTGAQEAVFDEGSTMLNKMSSILDSLVFNKDRALLEVTSDYSTTTELADVLQRDHDVPFRIGHHFASEMVNYGRAHDLKPRDLPYAEAQRIYAELCKKAGCEKPALPLSEADFHRVLTPENMVQSSKGLGGPQKTEVVRMLAEHQASLDSDRKWVKETNEKLDAADKALQNAFAGLR